MMSPAKRHRLKVLAEQQATAMTDDFGGYNKDASAYQLQLKELTNDKIRLKGIESIQTKIEEKRKLVPKYMPYVKGVIKADKPVDDLIVTTMMVWCIDTGFYHLALMIGNFVLKHNLKMSDNFSRSTASILVEELANAALETLKNDGDFDVGILNSVYDMTDALDMHDQIRAKLYHAIGKLYLKMEKGQYAVEFLKMALAKNPKIAAKQELKSAEKLAAEQT
ncbi:phage terminase small subunit [Acinetobacter populi]|nr:phage terminase small subunit [Acinetobacter populi]